MDESCADVMEEQKLLNVANYMGDIHKGSNHRKCLTIDVQDRDSNMYCRVCASQEQEMQKIFCEEEENLYIAEKISRCLPVIILPTDKLPLYICQNCVKKLNASYDFIITALKAEDFFKAKFFSFDDLQCWDKTQHDYYNKEVLQDDIQLGQNPSTIYEDGHEMIINEVLLEDSNLDQKKKKMCLDACSYLTFQGKSGAETNTRSQSVREKFTEGLYACPLNINGPVTCDVCDVTFSDMDAFDEHISNFHFFKFNWKCRLCDAGFEKSDELLTHKLLKHSDNMLSCGKCDLRNLEDRDVINKPKKIRQMFETCNNGNSEHVASTLHRKSGTKCNSGLESYIHDHYCKEGSEKVSIDMKCSIRDLTLTPERKCASISNVDRPFCNMCKESFTNYLTYSVHKKQCHNEMDTLKDNSGQNSYEGHFLTLLPKENGEEMDILITDVGEDKKSHSIVHENNEKKLSSMQCVTCRKVFTNETFYKRHRYIHDPEYWDRYKCKVCNRPFHDARSLADHMQLHSGVKPHMCDLCGRTYNRYANMLRHRKLHKPTNQWEHMCNHCQGKFEKLSDLMVHIERSHGLSVPENEKTLNKPSKQQSKWICRFCGKRVSTKLSLQCHERIHTGVKPFICEWCGREFRCHPNLLQHHLTHTGDRKHVCEVCGKKFARKAFIVQHMRVHTGEKPFECDVCGHRFTQAGDMRRHQRRHMEVRKDSVCLVEVPTDSNILMKVDT